MPTQCDTLVQVPGPMGPAGTNGTNGTNGIDAFSTTTAQFVMPAVGGGVDVFVDHSDWMTFGTNVNGQMIHIQNAGYFFVDNVISATHIHVNNVGYTGNALAGVVVPTAQKVSPGGLEGPQGPAGSIALSSPTNTKGDLIVDSGANNPLPDIQRFGTGGAGNDGKVLTAASAQALGLLYQGIDLSGALTVLLNTLALAKGGTAVDNTAIDANKFFGGPTAGLAGAASFRKLVVADLAGVVPTVPIVETDGGTGVILLPNFLATNLLQVFAATTPTKILFGTSVFNHGGNYDAAVNYRFTPTIPGVYHFNINYGYPNGAAADTGFLMLYKNGVVYHQIFWIQPAGLYATSGLSSLVAANGTTDYFEAYYYTVNGGTVAASAVDNWFSAHWAGP